MKTKLISLVCVLFVTVFAMPVFGKDSGQKASVNRQVSVHFGFFLRKAIVRIHVESGGRSATWSKDLDRFADFVGGLHVTSIDKKNGEKITSALEDLGVELDLSIDGLAAFGRDMADAISAMVAGVYFPVSMPESKEIAVGHFLMDGDDPGDLSGSYRVGGGSEGEDNVMSGEETSECDPLDTQCRFEESRREREAAMDRRRSGESSHDAYEDVIAPPEEGGECDRTCQQSGGEGGYVGVGLTWDLDFDHAPTLSGDLGYGGVKASAARLDLGSGTVYVGPALPSSGSGSGSGSGGGASNGGSQPDGGSEGSSPSPAPEPSGGSGSGSGEPSGSEPVASSGGGASPPGDYNAPTDGDPRVAMPNPEGGGGNRKWARAHIFGKHIKFRPPEPEIYPSEEAGGLREEDLARARVRYDIDCDTASDTANDSETSDNDDGGINKSCGGGLVVEAADPNYGVVDPSPE